MLFCLVALLVGCAFFSFLGSCFFLVVFFSSHIGIATHIGVAILLVLLLALALLLLLVLPSHWCCCSCWHNFFCVASSLFLHYCIAIFSSTTSLLFSSCLATLFMLPCCSSCVIVLFFSSCFIVLLVVLCYCFCIVSLLHLFSHCHITFLVLPCCFLCCLVTSCIAPSFFSHYHVFFLHCSFHVAIILAMMLLILS